METKIFIKQCKELIVEYFNGNADKTDKKQITEDDVFVVCSFKTFINGDKKGLYLDVNKKKQLRLLSSLL